MRQVEPLVSLARRSAQEVARAPIPQGIADASGAPVEFARLQRAIRRRRVQRRLVVGAAAVGMAAAAALLLVGPLGGGPALTYAVAGDVQIAGDILHARGNGPVQLDFSEGTKLVLSPGMRLKILKLDSRGARLQVNEGRAHFAVNGRPDARWAVAAGPFTVKVVGTRFDVAWASAEQTLEVAVTEGTVSVDGPSLLPLSLSAGRRLTVRGPNGQLEIAAIGSPTGAKAGQPKVVVRTETEVQPEAPRHALAKTPARKSPEPQRVAVNDPGVAERARSVPTTSPPPGIPPTPTPPPSLSPPSPVPPPPSRPTVAPVSWSTRMVGGEYRTIVDEALAGGLDRILRARASADLSALSDAARYVGRADVARKALLTQRQRFPDTEDAARAAFHLGTLAERQDATSGEALKWYEVYLSSAPAGAFVPEASGRRMLMLERRDDTTAARSAAEDYRRLFPRGPYRRQADRILARP